MSQSDLQTLPVFSSEMISSGEVHVEIYPMLNDEDGSRLVDNADIEPDFYDIMLRPEIWGDNDSPYGEWENLDWQAANDRVADLSRRYPGIAVSWING